MVEHSKELTEAEAELYDRQIRLWGLDSQKRLGRANVLIIGIGGFGAEITKNIILAGVKSLTMLDDKLLSKEDRFSQFLAPTEEIGTNRAEASYERAKQLNPMVKVVVDVAKSSDKDNNYFKQFDVICVTESSAEEIKRINDICRQENVMFFCGDVYGFFGYTFEDLLSYEYSEEVTKTYNPTKGKGSGEPPSKVSKTERIKSTVLRNEVFVPFKNVLDIDLKDQTNSKRGELSECYFLFRIILSFIEKHNRKPSIAERVKELAILKEIRDSVLKDMDVSLDKVTDDILITVFAQLSPVCAILGGILAQEIIKAVSHKGAPLNNLFFFDPNKNVGFVEKIPSDHEGVNPPENIEEVEL